MTLPDTRTPGRRASPLARVVETHGRRRIVAAGLLWPVLVVAASAITGGSAGPGLGQLVLLALFALVGAAVLATYLPVDGPWYRLQTGCTRCAVAAGMSLPVGFFVLSTAPLDTATTLLALAVVTFGLGQRLRDPATCPTR